MWQFESEEEEEGGGGKGMFKRWNIITFLLFFLSLWLPPVNFFLLCVESSIILLGKKKKIFFFYSWVNLLPLEASRLGAVLSTSPCVNNFSMGWWRQPCLLSKVQPFDRIFQFSFCEEEEEEAGKLKIAVYRAIYSSTSSLFPFECLETTLTPPA